MNTQNTGSKPCRDCGFLLDQKARGCPKCALNVEAERMIEKVVWGVLLLAGVIAGATVYLFLR